MSEEIKTKAHATLGASTASRWMQCPGSVRLIRGVPPKPSTSFAREGTAVHGIIERCLRETREPGSFLDEEVEGVKVTEQMVLGAEVFVDYVRQITRDASIRQVPTTWIEEQFDLAALNPPEPMFGTADFVLYDPGAKLLHVVDYKNGSGVVVNVFENKQLKYYALGVLLKLGAGREIDNIQLTIVQPNAPHKDGSTRSFTLPYLDLIGFANELKTAAALTQMKDAPLASGDHCRFCPASGVCPEQGRAALAVAQTEFSTIDTHQPPAPETLPDEVFFSILPHLKKLKDWCRDMEQNRDDRMMRGESVPGFKVVERRANRSWVDEAEVIKFLKMKTVADEEMFKMELKSPAQIEKVIGKKNLPPELTQKISSGYKIVAEDAAGTPVQLDPGSEFAALPAGSDSDE